MTFFDLDDLVLLVLLIVVTIVATVVAIMLFLFLRMVRRGSMRLEEDDDNLARPRPRVGVSLTTPLAIRDTLRENGERALVVGIGDADLRRAADRVFSSSSPEVESLWERYVDVCRLVTRSARAEKGLPQDKNPEASGSGYAPESPMAVPPSR